MGNSLHPEPQVGNTDLVGNQFCAVEAALGELVTGRKGLGRAAPALGLQWAQPCSSEMHTQQPAPARRCYWEWGGLNGVQMLP